MNFVYPEFLFALAAISVPIIIHLFNFRRFKKVYFSDIRFLKNVQIETKSKNQLKNILILISRILAVAFLVLAFARPLIPSAIGGQQSKSNTVVVFIDNSFSMDAMGGNGQSALAEAKAKAIEIGNVYANGAELYLLTNDFDPKHLRNLSIEEFKNEVSTVQTSPNSKTFTQLVSRSASMSLDQQGLELFYISDLQRNSLDISENVNDSLLTIYLVPIEVSSNSNIYVDSCWFESPSRLPEQPDELHARIRNSGSSSAENISVKLKLNGVQRSVGTLDITSEGFEDVVLPFTNDRAGIQYLEVSVEDYPISYDDSYFMSYQISAAVSVTLINGTGASTHLEKLYGNDENFQLTMFSQSSFDYSALANTDLLILNEVVSFSSGMNEEMMNFVQKGGHLLYIPPVRPDLNSTNEFMLSVGGSGLGKEDSTTLKVEGVNLESVIYKNVFTDVQERIDLPQVNKHFTVNRSVRSATENLLTLANGDQFLCSYSSEKGRAYVLSAPLKDDWTNFQRHALFVPTLYNIALNSIAGGVSHEVIGSGKLIPTKTRTFSDGVLQMESADKSYGFIPERVIRPEGTGILVHDQVREHGQYLLRSNTGDSIQPVSFNYQRAESELSFTTAEDLLEEANKYGIKNVKVVEGAVESIAQQIDEIKHGKQLWRICLVLALICLLAETLFIRIL